MPQKDDKPVKEALEELKKGLANPPLWMRIKSSILLRDQMWGTLVALVGGVSLLWLLYYMLVTPELPREAFYPMLIIIIALGIQSWLLEEVSKLKADLVSIIRELLTSVDKDQ